MGIYRARESFPGCALPRSASGARRAFRVLRRSPGQSSNVPFNEQRAPLRFILKTRAVFLNVMVPRWAVARGGDCSACIGLVPDAAGKLRHAWTKAHCALQKLPEPTPDHGNLSNPDVDSHGWFRAALVAVQYPRALVAEPAAAGVLGSVCMSARQEHSQTTG
jgi:hypothetical protein